MPTCLTTDQVCAQPCDYRVFATEKGELRATLARFQLCGRLGKNARANTWEITAPDGNNYRFRGGLNLAAMRLVLRASAQWLTDLGCEARIESEWQSRWFAVTGEHGVMAAALMRLVADGIHGHLAAHQRTIDLQQEVAELKRTLKTRDAKVAELRAGVVQRRRAEAKMQFVYLMDDGKQYKIGISRDPVERAKGLTTACGRKVTLLLSFEGTEADEKALHAKFAKHRTIGEWFRRRRQIVAEFRDRGAE